MAHRGRMDALGTVRGRVGRGWVIKSGSRITPKGKSKGFREICASGFAGPSGCDQKQGPRNTTKEEILIQEEQGAAEPQPNSLERGNVSNPPGSAALQGGSLTTQNKKPPWKAALPGGFDKSMGGKKRAQKTRNGRIVVRRKKEEYKSRRGFYILLSSFVLLSVVFLFFVRVFSPLSLPRRGYG
ncbi:MAG: hypothetical protein BECKG1743F_GA0114225_1001110 [Candidatus Kentron sp. G]|nr:MAG: hypothetical protein BECKG1743F_GA0114225_1001110 [Candidatus Kentron sp. G]